MTFLVKFFSFVPPPLPPLTEAEVPVVPTFFKLCLVENIEAMIDYQPKRVNYTALMRGQLEELMGFLYLSEARLALPRVSVRGVTGLDGVLSGVLSAWLNQVC